MKNIILMLSIFIIFSGSYKEKKTLKITHKYEHKNYLPRKANARKALDGI